MKLPEHFEKRRDENRPTNLHFMCEDVTCDAKNGYNLGYKAAYADLMAEVLPLIKAMTFVKSELIAINNYDETRFKHMSAWQECNKALADWQKKFGDLDEVKNE